MTSGSETQDLSYRELVKYRLDTLQKAIDKLGDGIVTREKLLDVENRVHSLQEAMDELENTVRSNEREIIFARRVTAVLGGVVLTLSIAWIKVLLGL